VGEEAVGEAATMSRRRRATNAALLIGVIVVAWQLLFWSVGANALASPSETLRFACQLLASPSFYPHLQETAGAFAIALLIAVSLGVLIGTALGAHRFAGEVGEPILVGIYSIPKITLYPIVLLAFGIGLPAKIAFGAMHGVVPIAIFTMGALRNLNPVYLKTARVQRLSPWQTASTILFPASIPEMFTGVRIGFALTLIGTLLGEMFASQRGVGYLLMQAIGLHNIRMIMALTFLLVCVTVTVSAILLSVDRRLHRRIAAPA
jgi:NitT/TauT family transport system permease protein